MHARKTFLVKNVSYTVSQSRNRTPFKENNFFEIGSNDSSIYKNKLQGLVFQITCEKKLLKKLKLVDVHDKISHLKKNLILALNENLKHNFCRSMPVICIHTC